MKRVVVKGKKLELRERTREDLHRELEWKKDEQICFLEGLFHNDGGLEDYDIEDWIERSLKDNSDKILFSIYSNTEEHIGSVGYFPTSPDKATGEAGIVIGNKKFWGRGFGKEGANLFLDYIFRERGVKKVTAVVKNFNPMAIKIALKGGFVEKKRVSRVSAKYGDYEEIYLEMEKK